METYTLTIVSPRGKVLDQPVESVVVPGYDGEMGILAHHAPLLAALRRGVTRIQAGGKTSFFVTGEGVIEVTPEEVVVLVDTAEQAESLDDAKALLHKPEPAPGKKK